MSFATSFNVLTIGGSRNVGYYASLRLLAAGATITFLLRNPAVLDFDIGIQTYVKNGKAFLIKGDALIKSDVEHAWEEAKNNGTKDLDLLLFTVGGTPTFTLAKGAVITPLNLVTQSLLNVLCTMPRITPQPRIVVISAIGTTHASRSELPFALKPVYNFMLSEPLKDKLGVECALAHVAGWAWRHEEPNEDIIGGADWKNLEGLPRRGEVKRILLVRPAMYTDGECLAENEGEDGKAYRVSEQDISGWSISRKDVAYFVVDAVLNRCNTYSLKLFFPT